MYLEVDYLQSDYGLKLYSAVEAGGPPPNNLEIREKVSLGCFSSHSEKIQGKKSTLLKGPQKVQHESWYIT